MDIWIHRIKDKNHLMRLSLQKHCEACTILSSFYRLKNLGSTEVDQIYYSLSSFKFYNPMKYIIVHG